MINRGLTRAAAAAAAAAALAAVLYFNPPTPQAFYPKCLLHQWTGLHCPGCGGTRAAYALLHGRLGDAFRYNAFTLTVLPAVVVSWGYQRLRYGPPPHSLYLRMPVWVGWTLAGCTIAFAVLRNLPVWPLYYLAPPPVAAGDR